MKQFDMTAVREQALAIVAARRSGIAAPVYEAQDNTELSADEMREAPANCTVRDQAVALIQARRSNTTPPAWATKALPRATAASVDATAAVPAIVGPQMRHALELIAQFKSTRAAVAAKRETYRW